jgi:hypothetical protein
LKSDPKPWLLTSSLTLTLTPRRGLKTSSRESAPTPSSRLRTLYGRVESICASEGAVMPTAALGLFASVLSSDGLVVAVGNGLRAWPVGKM